MATMTSSFSSSRLTRAASAPSQLSRSLSRALASPPSFLSIRTAANPRSFRRLVASVSSFENMSCDENSRPPKPNLAGFVQEIEPLNVSLIQKDVPLTTVDAVKRTISGMLGLLPSDRFQVSIEALWEPVSNLLVSSMMTGYTMRNAEYRLCLERNLDLSDEDLEARKCSALDVLEILSEGGDIPSVSRVDQQLPSKSDIQRVENSADNGIDGLGELTPQAQDYIAHLESSLSSLKKELRDLKSKNAAVYVRQLVGEEKNELLNYLRSLEPEKVAELSEPASHEVRETVHSVVHGLLATLSPKIQSKALPSDNTTGTLNVGSEDCAELLENDTSLQFQPLISLSRDYLARLLFWCMLLGHYIRGLEHRMELARLLSFPNDAWLEGDQIQ
uniref:MAR-binding filament-like protein 1 n=1 Tax=Kalanchoe fedtschenkoi TaxID=63787 RepID=A0A7N0ZXR8_KALFE